MSTDLLLECLHLGLDTVLVLQDDNLLFVRVIIGVIAVQNRLRMVGCTWEGGHAAFREL